MNDFFFVLYEKALKFDWKFFPLKNAQNSNFGARWKLFKKKGEAGDFSSSFQQRATAARVSPRFEIFEFWLSRVGQLGIILSMNSTS